MPLAGRLLATTARMLRLTDHFINVSVQSLLKVVDHRGKQVGGQPLVASLADKIGLFKPIHLLMDRFAAEGAIQSYL